MKVNLNEVISIFDRVLSGDITREDASDWAKERQLAADSGELEFETTTEKEKVWNAILYLEGIDLNDGPNSYLHIDDDLQNYRAEISS